MEIIKLAKNLLSEKINYYGSITEVAKQINYNAGRHLIARSSLSLFYHGKYPAGEQRISQTIINFLGDFYVLCPATGDKIPTSIYEKNMLATMPINDPTALKQWGIYQSLKRNKNEK